MRVRLRWVLPIVGAAGVGVVSWGPLRACAAAYRSTSPFISTQDPRVSYEPGAEAQARVVEAAMPAAVARVETAMGGSFQGPVHVYVCASIDSFAAYGASPRAGGNTINHRVFISPKPANTPERIPRVLAHELTHLYLAQNRPVMSAHTIPVWFDEGLAVDVSGGGGAENVSEAEAWRAIARGSTFVPDGDETPLGRRGARDSGLDEHMFYRQAALYVAFLRSLDEIKFKRFIAALAEGGGFAESFRLLGVAPDAAWRRFCATREVRGE